MTLTPNSDQTTLQRLEAARAALSTAADEAERSAISSRTRGLYEGDWKHFRGFCDALGESPLPASVDTLRMFIMDMTLTVDTDGRPTYKMSTVARRLAAIAHYHLEAGYDPPPTRDPRVTKVLTGATRERKESPRRMRPLLLDDIRSVLASMTYTTWPQGASATRDAFVLLAGFAGAFRRSELAAMNHAHVTWNAYDGLHLRVESSKTDQTGKGSTLPLPYGEHPGTCPVCAYVRWARFALASAESRSAAMRVILDQKPWTEWEHVCREGVPDIDPQIPLLQPVRNGILGEGGISGDALHAMVKRRAKVAGYHREIGFHSLRAGFVTQARRNGCDPRSIRNQTRHSSDAVMDTYDREFAPLLNNAVTKLGL